MRYAPQEDGSSTTTAVWVLVFIVIIGVLYAIYRTAIVPMGTGGKAEAPVGKPAETVYTPGAGYVVAAPRTGSTVRTERSATIDAPDDDDDEELVAVDLIRG